MGIQSAYPHTQTFCPLPQGSYVSLGLARSPADWRNIAIVVGVIGALVGGNAAVKSANTASVSRKRQRALKELEKSE